MKMPMFSGIQTSKDSDLTFHDDLKTTIKKLFHEEVRIHSLNSIVIRTVQNYYYQLTVHLSFSDVELEELETKGTVCVTGGTGFIGSWIIKSLLEHGYSINTIIRSDPGCKRDVSFLKNLPSASEKLRFFKADLSDPESFGPAVEGCVGIFHTATPIDFAVNEPEEVVTKRAIEGALGILKAAVKSKSVKRVVYTSSASTNGLEVVSLVPPFVVGRFICPKLPDSVERALLLLFGKKEEIGVIRYHMVHVDDLLEHISFCWSILIPKGDITVHPSLEAKEIKGAKLPHLDSQKLVDAGFEFKYSVEDIFTDAIECCKQNGYL
ncbi:hypothetical protein LR48_Vigan03g063800 [Vigna angularis]|uniref:3-beta hydroxysteroid dehydrogenase/isomerase domain-containing protein n=1 Tax=Phaseolus angularis TaxID=3914 RepID=A0A0L9U3J9_PHAAN|nr:hypothetical protein LR48_Vigan03g063800 [Vigna angularis]